MRNNAIAKLIAATLLAATFAPTSSAQEVRVPEGIEVITIVAKRTMPVVASACINDVMAQAPVASLRDQGDFQPGTAVARMINNIEVRQALRNCVQKAVAIGEAQI